jgi:hypothetical protein
MGEIENFRAGQAHN